ncbi:MAG: 50S ribosomal protein L13 [Elusimicrobiales bacterium]
MQKTWLPSRSEVEASRKWHYVDASSLPLGRLATKVASLLAGKHKRTQAPLMDCGDFVVVTNAEKVKLTGNKPEQKFYFHHTGYNNGAKVVPFKRQMANDPTRVVELAVKRMLDDNKLRAHRMRRLKVFKGAEHTYPVAKPKAAKAA